MPPSARVSAGITHCATSRLRTPEREGHREMHRGKEEGETREELEPENKRKKGAVKEMERG
jgi:hypothetical protein